MMMLNELVANAFESTSAGVVGVGLIFAYFALILGTACYRIKKAEHMHH